MSLASRVLRLEALVCYQDFQRECLGQLRDACAATGLPPALQEHLLTQVQAAYARLPPPAPLPVRPSQAQADQWMITWCPRFGQTAIAVLRATVRDAAQCQRLLEALEAGMKARLAEAR